MPYIVKSPANTVLKHCDDLVDVVSCVEGHLYRHVYGTRMLPYRFRKYENAVLEFIEKLDDAFKNSEPASFTFHHFSVPYRKTSYYIESTGG